MSPLMTTALSDLSAAFAALVAGAAPSVVSLRSGRSRAAGFAWRPRLIVTADELIDDDDDLRLTLPGGEEVGGQLVGRDHTTDVALVRIERELPPLAFSHEVPAPGALAFAVGSENGAPRVASGVVAHAGPPWRSLRGGAIDARVELDVALARTSEGAAVLDAAGVARGMAVRSRRRTLMIPASTIARVAATLEAKGYIPRGYLGLALHPVKTPQGAGAMIMAVEAGGPGEKAGLHQGEVITGWDGGTSAPLGAIMAALGPDSVGKAVKLTVALGGATREAALTIAERPRP
jgi:S1-C subfamily serine protease